MLAVHLQEGVVQVRQYPRPRRRRKFALIRLLCGGICNTDLELQRGYYGFRGTPGHEFVGEVVEADTAELLGRRVVGEINLNCGKCVWCRKGLGRHCSARTTLGIAGHPGVFSEYFTLPEQNLHVLPASVATEEGVFAEPLAAACEILEQVRIPRGMPLAVLGDGKLGLLVAQVLQVQGAKVTLFGHGKHKLRLAGTMGIDAKLSPRKIPGATYDLVVEATGSSAGLEQAVQMVKPRGVVVMKSTVHDKVSLDTAPIVVNEITLVGSRCGRFKPALRLLKNRTVQVAPLVEARYPLAEAALAFERASKRGALKVLLIP